jgi:hypothetical protein
MDACGWVGVASEKEAKARGEKEPHASTRTRREGAACEERYGGARARQER